MSTRLSPRYSVWEYLIVNGKFAAPVQVGSGLPYSAALACAKGRCNIAHPRDTTPFRPHNVVEVRTDGSEVIQDGVPTGKRSFVVEDGMVFWRLVRRYYYEVFYRTFEGEKRDFYHVVQYTGSVSRNLVDLPVLTFLRWLLQSHAWDAMPEAYRSMQLDWPAFRDLGRGRG